ncbi:hypothetical protein Golax_020504, partial [Gossypium laxum]|nr:hypothetical protein [Gossypium laxum]
VDLVSTIEEYIAFLCYPRIQADKVYSRAVNVLTFVKKLMNITGKSEQWVSVQIKQKGEIKLLGYIDEVVPDLFDRLDRRVTPVLVILAETFKSLNTCRRTGEGRSIGCAQLILAL